MSDQNTTNLWIVEDHEEFMDNFIEKLSEDSQFRFTAKFTNSTDMIIAFAQSEMPDLLILDYRLPDYKANMIIPALKKKAEDLKILILTAHEDEDVLIECLNAGADGFLVKGASTNETKKAIQDVINGNHPIDSKMTSYLFKGKTLVPSNALPAIVISKREREVIVHLARGLTKPKIADELNISPHTVDSFLRRAFEKMDCNNQAELIAKAFLYGVISGNDISS